MQFGIVYYTRLEIILSLSWYCFPISPCSFFSPLFSLSPLSLPYSFPFPSPTPSLFCLSISLQKYTFSMSSNKVVVSNWDSWWLTSEVCYTGKSWIICRKGLLELLYLKNISVCVLFVLYSTTRLKQILRKVKCFICLWCQGAARALIHGFVYSLSFHSYMLMFSYVLASVVGNDITSVH